MNCIYLSMSINIVWRIEMENIYVIVDGISDIITDI